MVRVPVVRISLLPPHGCKSRISSPPNDNVHHVRIQWNGNPLLLFSDPIMVEALPVEHFRQQASHMTHQQHLQMGVAQRHGHPHLLCGWEHALPGSPACRRICDE